MAETQPTTNSPPVIPPLVKNVDTDYLIDRFDRHKLINGIPRHLVLILISMALAFAASLSLTYYYLTTYQAEAVVIFQEDRDSKPLFGNYTLSKVTIQTVLDIIRLPSNFQAVKSVLGLDLDPKVIEGMVYVPVPRTESNLISITARADNPNLAVDIANTVARIAVKSSQDFVQKQLGLVLDNFRNQLDSTREKLSIQLSEIEEFKKKFHYFEMTADYAVLLTDFANTRSKLQEAELGYNRLLVEYESLQSEVARMPDYVPLPDEVAINPYLERLEELESALSVAQERYSKSNPKLIALERELESLKKRSADQYKGDTQQMVNNVVKEKLQIELIRMQGKVKAAKSVQEELIAKLVNFDLVLQNLPAQQVDFARLLGNKALTEERIRYLTEGLETLQLMINVPRGSLELYQIADKAKPYKDSILVRLIPLFGLILGTILGIALAVMLEMRDKHIWTSKQVEINYNIPCWITIPEFKSLNLHNGEAKTLFFIRAIVDRLEKISSPAGRTLSIALASSTTNEGKSLLSYFLALYYQRLGKQVLLLEGETTSAFTAHLPFAAVPLEEYLQGDHPFEQAIEHSDIDRIRISHKSHYLKELLKSPKMLALQELLNKTYDVIIIDAPNLIHEEYSANLIALAKVCLFVIGAKYVEKPLVDESLTALQTAGIIPAGIVLNRVLPIYIEDERIKLELKRDSKGWFSKQQPTVEREMKP